MQILSKHKYNKNERNLFDSLSFIFDTSVFDNIIIHESLQIINKNKKYTYRVWGFDIFFTINMI